MISLIEQIHTVKVKGLLWRGEQARMGVPDGQDFRMS